MSVLFVKQQTSVSELPFKGLRSNDSSLARWKARSRIDFYSQKMTNLLFEPPFGGLRSNVRTSSIARWKARGRLFIRDVELFC